MGANPDGWRKLLSREETADTRVMARALAALFGAGGTLTLASLFFRHWPGLEPWGLAAPAIVAELTAIGLLLGSGRIPGRAFHLFLALGTGCICVAVHYGGTQGHSIYAAYFTWVTLYGFYFFKRTAAFAHLALAAAGYVVVLVVTPTVAAGPAWLVMMGTATMTGLVIASLVGKVRDLAQTDPLTGLANRRAWSETLSREAARAARHATPLCVAILDLDGLKVINDERGHLVGDHVIVDAAQRWNAVLRKGDLLARLGGDEFGLVLPSCQLDDARMLLTRMNDALREQSVSCGVACLGADESPDALVARADRALYEAKRTGRNRVVAAA